MGHGLRQEEVHSSFGVIGTYVMRYTGSFAIAVKGGLASHLSMNRGQVGVTGRGTFGPHRFAIYTSVFGGTINGLLTFDQ